MSECDPATLKEMGTFPHRCSVCGVVCESVAELADPDHHQQRRDPGVSRNWPIQRTTSTSDTLSIRWLSVHAQVRDGGGE